jgi:hypothetical protein
MKGADGIVVPGGYVDSAGSRNGFWLNDPSSGNKYGLFQFLGGNMATGIWATNQPGFLVEGSNWVAIRDVAYFGWASGALSANSTNDLRLYRDSSGTLAQRNATNAQTFRVYNTYTSATNYELGKLEWSSNVFRIGTEKGSGGGTARAVEVHTDSVSRLALDTTGSVRVVTGLTVATLPGTPAVGMIARVTNATAPAVGSTVTGGGSAAALVWYNGTNWTVLGV